MILDKVKIHKYTHINHKLSVCLVGERGRMEPLHSHHAPIWLEETQSGAALKSKYSLHIRNHTARKNWLNLTAHECSCSSFLSSNRYEQPSLPHRATTITGGIVGSILAAIDHLHSLQPLSSCSHPRSPSPSTVDTLIHPPARALQIRPDSPRLSMCPLGLPLPLPLLRLMCSQHAPPALRPLATTKIDPNAPSFPAARAASLQSRA
jgi:hypothetical protein